MSVVEQSFHEGFTPVRRIGTFFPSNMVAAGAITTAVTLPAEASEIPRDRKLCYYPKEGAHVEYVVLNFQLFGII